MATNEQEVEKLLAQASRYAKNNPTIVVSAAQKREIEELIAACKTSSKDNAHTIERAKNAAQELSSTHRKNNVDLANLIKTETDLLERQIAIGTAKRELHDTELQIMTAEHKLRETKLDTNWELKQHITAQQFEAEALQREIAIRNENSKKRIKRLLAHERNPHLSIGSKHPLHRAVMAGDISEVKRLIADGADVNASDLNGNYPVCDIMAFNIPNNFEILSALIEAGVNINQENRAGWTAMNFRCANLVGVQRDPRTLKLLQKHNAKGGKDPRFVVTGWVGSSTGSEQKHVRLAPAGKIAIQDSANSITAKEYSQRMDIPLEVYHEFQRAFISNRTVVKRNFTSSEEPSNFMLRLNEVAPVILQYFNSIPKRNRNQASLPPQDERNVLQAFVTGVANAYRRTGTFIGQEAGRLTMGHQTQTAGVFKTVGTAIGEDIARWRLGESSFLRYTLTERGLARTADGAIAFTRENVSRAIEKLSHATVNDVAEFFGDSVGFGSMGWVVGRVANGATSMVGRVAKPITPSSNNVHATLSSWGNFKARYISANLEKIDVAELRLKYLRTSKRNDLPITSSQKTEITAYAEKLGFPKDAIYFYEDMNISYGRMFGQERLHIGLDVLPAQPGMGKTANSRVSMKGAIAHEIVGHRSAELAGKVNPNILLEEVQASIRAARYAPDLNPTERFTLLKDAMERLQKAGISIKDVKHQLWIEPDALAPKLRGITE